MFLFKLLAQRPVALALALLIPVAGKSSAAELLIPGEPLPLAHTQGKFDFLAVDPERRRLLAAHTGNGSLDAIDLDKRELIKSVPTGAAQDCAVDAKGHRYLVSLSKPPQLAIVDAEKLEVTGTVPLDGPADLLAFNEKTQTAYVGHDDGEQLWVVSPAEKKVVGTVKLPSDSPEDLAFDDANEHLFQALKTAGTIAVIEVATNKVIANWSTAPAKAPHGIARVRAIHALAIAGGNGKLVLMDERGGKVTASADLPERVDQIAYDADLHHLYCASALGKIAVFDIQEGRLVSLGEVSTSAGAKSIALDPKTHTLWVAYVKDGVGIVQPFSTSGK